MKKLFAFFLIISFLTGCNMMGQGEVKPLYIGSNKVEDQTKADEAKQIVLSMDEVTAVRGATFDEDIYVAVKVKQFDRFFLDEIRKEAYDKIKKRYPDAKVHVSTDKKVLLELEKLEIQINNNKIKRKEFEKQWKRIEDFMKG
ncbi:YhcN/YlaJ family sporulation lipoprotein [Anaerobacillus isosaccharinicus]|uniref:YhcN/YlaJ family sporulation lipoprotein n=1 Tax=Anaerobacillus isosaccharinicus TaxID=1532552 RepID=A0A1S2M6E0_9BACI|nr:YhcN/YlaJ family sporulation lipoprotein [Anaerobacillus isosaccharinicus]MBA5585768.1 YhcN/YlaJ family sporulation lipoprotein [Anaerobacillus isosaccharinicus]QOY35932.1 YhcN/YlaJ family sporulation lipoprotein [Anaerobacillus isosaccharinicus]